MRGSTSTLTSLPLTSNLVVIPATQFGCLAGPHCIVSPCRRGLECALGHGAGERCPIGRAGVDVVLRLDRRGRGLADLRHDRIIDGVAVERGLGGRKALLAVTDAEHADMRVGGLAAS